MHEQGGQPGIDLIGARQTIDTLGMISRKDEGQSHSEGAGLSAELSL